MGEVTLTSRRNTLLVRTWRCSGAGAGGCGAGSALFGAGGFGRGGRSGRLWAMPCHAMLLCRQVGTVVGTKEWSLVWHDAGTGAGRLCQQKA